MTTQPKESIAALLADLLEEIKRGYADPKGDDFHKVCEIVNRIIVEAAQEGARQALAALPDSVKI